MKCVIRILLSLMVSTSVYAQKVPQLIDLELVGPKEAAYFSPSRLVLQEGETYLFVVNNPHPFPYRFVSEHFAEAITTQYIQGSPAVTKQSVMISPQSKVQWVFQTSKSGQYPYHAESYGLQTMKQHEGMIQIMGNQPQAVDPKWYPPSSEAEQAQKPTQVAELKNPMFRPAPSWSPDLKGIQYNRHP